MFLPHFYLSNSRFNGNFALEKAAEIILVKKKKRKK